MISGETFILGIENKLGAPDGDDQLTAYIDSLAGSSGAKEYYLVYLTLDGHEPDEKTLSKKARDDHAGHIFNLAWTALLTVLEECATRIPP